MRRLTEEDLRLLSEEKGSKPAPLQRLRERHHALARNLAGGMRPEAAAAICGLSVSRVSILQGDPAFKDLVLFYRSEVEAQYAQVHEQLAGASLDALVILRERMEDTPDKIKTETLMEVVKMGADRTGYGPTSKTDVNVNVNLASRLEEARKRVAARTIELVPNKE